MSFARDVATMEHCRLNPYHSPIPDKTIIGYCAVCECEIHDYEMYYNVEGTLACNDRGCISEYLFDHVAENYRE